MSSKLPTLHHAKCLSVLALLLCTASSALFAASTPLPGEIAYWRLDDAVGSPTATDSTGGNTGTLFNAPVFAPAGGQVIGALNFNGTSQYVDCGNSPTLNLNGDMSCSAWIFMTAINRDQKIIAKQDVNTGTGGYKMGVYTDNKFEFEIRDAANNAFLSRTVGGGTVLAANTWYHVVGVYSAGNYIRTYVNGVLDRELLLTNLCGATATNFVIGREGGSLSLFWQGKLDDIHFINRAVSATEVGALYRGFSINAGPDQAPTLPGVANLAGTATWIVEPNPAWTLSPVWSRTVSGGGTVSYVPNPPNAFNVAANFTANGTHTMTLTVSSNNGRSGTDDMLVTGQKQWDGGDAGTNNWTSGGNNNWTGAIPVAGDPLIFGAVGAARKTTNTNNFANNTDFGTIFFKDNGYILSGNAIDLLSGIQTSNTTGNNTMNMGLRLLSDQTFTSGVAGTTLQIGTTALAGTGALNLNGFTLTLAGPGDFVFNGVISGSGQIYKTGTGTLTLTGTNTYNGVTQIDAGTVIVSNNSGLGSATGGTVVNPGATLQVQGNIASAEPLSLSGTGNGGIGALRSTGNNFMTGDVQLGTATTIQSITAGNTLTMSGNFVTNTFDVTYDGVGNTIESGIVSGSGGIVKNGSGTLTLSGASTYTGATTINTGITVLSSNAGLGATSGTTTVVSGATLETSGTITSAEPITLAGTGVGGIGALRNIANTNTLSGAIVQSANATLVSAAGTLVLTGGLNNAGFDTTFDGATNSSESGVISGGGDLIKNGAGILTLSGANTYGGVTTINVGTVANGAANVIPNTSAVTVAAGATYNLTNFNEQIASLAGAGTVGLGSAANTFTVGDANNTTFSGVITGTNNGAAVVKVGSGTLTLSGTNTYTGATTISTGILNIQSAAALGGTTVGTTVASGAALQLQGASITYAAEPLTLNGAGVGAAGALENVSGNNTWAGAVTLASASEIASDAGTLTVTGAVNNAGFLLTVDGAGNVTDSSVISGTGGLTKNNTGLLTLSGTNANTFTGVTTVNTGELDLSKTAGQDAIRGALIVGSDDGTANNDIVKLTANNQINDASAVTVTSSGLLSMQTFTDTIGSLTLFSGTTSGANVTGTGAITLAGNVVSNFFGTGASRATVAAPLNLGGVVRTFTVDDGAAATDLFISSVISNGGLSKAGTGTLELTGVNTYTGATTVSTGSLLVNGTTAAGSAVGVSAGATLGGSGTAAGAVTVTSATLSPGGTLFGTAGSIGTLNTGNLTFNNNTSTLLLEVTPTVSDQVNVTGTVNLNNVSLNGSAAPGTYTTDIVLINNDGADAVVGTFNGLPEGSAVTTGGNTFLITYVGGTGNDVVLRPFPFVTNVTSSTADGTYGIGATVSIQVTFTQVVTVTGTPQLTLNTGATVNYSSGSGTSTLTFTYTVAAGQNTADLDYSATTSLGLNGGTIKGPAPGSVNAILTLPTPGASGSLGFNKAIVIDTTPPTVTNVTSITADGTYGVAAVVDVTVQFSKVVAVTGTPQLTLNTGAVVNYFSGSGSNTLTFRYTVAAGQNTADLDYAATTSLALNAGTIRDTVLPTGNNATLTLAAPGAANSLGFNKAIVIDTTAPTVTNVTSALANGTYGVGAVVDITVQFSEVVTLVPGTGTLQLTLETGTVDEVVNYFSGSGTNTLTFRYTVAAGDTSADLDYKATNSLALTGTATLRDGAGPTGNNATLTLAAPGAAPSLGFNKAIVIDTTPPTVTNVTSTTADGTYGTAATVDVTVQFSEAVNVTGTPQLTLNTGAVVNYFSGTGTNTLTFRYTVAAGQNTADLDYAATTSLALNGGTIRDSASPTANNATLTLAAPGAVGSLGNSKAIVIDTTAPTVTAVTSALANGTYGVGAVVDITVQFNEVVTLVPGTGTLQLQLETGTVDEVVNYFSGSGTNTLTFRYTVVAGDTSADLDYKATTALALTGTATLRDSASPTGNNATLTLAAPGAVGSLGNSKAIVIDTTPPVVTNVTSITADGTYGVAAVVDVTVQFNKVVAVTGTPQLTLNTGAVVNYFSGSGSNTLTFRYTVAAGQNTADLDYAATTSLALNGGTIRDSVLPTGNNATLTLAAPGAATSLGFNKAIVIDTTPPTVTNVTSITADGTYGTAAVVDVTVQFNKVVAVTGTPQLTLNTGAVVNYFSGTGSNTLTFRYTVAAGQNTADLDYAATTSLALNGGTIRDGVLPTGNNATLTLAAPGAANSLGFNKAIVIDTTPPAVANVTSITPDGTYGVAGIVDVTVQFNEVVNVVGTPQLTLNTGAVVNYFSGTGTNTLTFRYTVAAGQNTADLDYAATTSLALNGGTIRDSASPTGNNATLTLAAPGAANSLGFNKAIVIDTTPPAVTNVTSITADGTYGTAAIVDVTVQFSEPVNVTGTPQLTLNTGAVVNYFSGTGTNTLTFRYTVAAGQNTADLDYAATTSLALNGGTIRDSASPTANTATLTLAAPGTATSLGFNKNIVIDTTAPAVTAVTSALANGTYGVGAVVDITVQFNEVVTLVPGTGTLQLTLETGTVDEVVNYFSGSGTNTLTFRYTVAAGDTSADLDYKAIGSLALTGTATLRDSASPTGNNASLTLAAPGAVGSLGNSKAIIIDTTAPAVTAVTSALANGTYGIGAVIDITVQFNEVVTLVPGTGTLQLTLETGTVDEVVNYFSGSGTSTLTFRYTVVAGDASLDLDYKATTSLALTGTATLRDGASPTGNNASLTLAAPGAAGSLGNSKAIVIDTVVPTVTNVTSALADGTYGLGTVVDVTVQFSKVVNVTGTPQLTLNTGAVVNYLSGTGTNTLTFRYTVAAGQNTADLDYAATTSLALNGGTIRDSTLPTGNNASLTLAAPGTATSLGFNKNIVIDTAAPTVANVTSALANGTYGVGAVVDITVQFNEVVTLVPGTGTLQLQLETGTVDEVVNYFSGSGTNTLTFRYTVVAGDTSADLDYKATTSLVLTGSATLRDGASPGNNASLNLAAPGTATSLGSNKNIVIDTTAPAVTNVTSALPNGTYGIGAVVDVTVQFNEVVNVTGTPQLALNTGILANYFSGSGSSTLTFRYTVGAGQNAADLDYTATTALTLNSGTIRDIASPTPNNAVLTLAAPGAAGSLGNNKNIVIDTSAPAVTSVSSPNANGIYTTGGVIDVTVTFSEPVNVTGTPQLTLETGAVDAVANYVSGSGGATLTFRFTVAAGYYTADLDTIGTTALALNGGTIRDLAAPTGNNAILSLPVPGGANSLSVNKDIKISTPTITARETQDTDGNGFIDAIRITTDQPLFDNFTGLNITVTGYTLAGASYDTGATANDNEIFVRLTEGPAPDTAATPSVKVVAGGNLLLPVDATAVVPVDKARPVLLAADWFDASGGGVTATDTIILTWSEPVLTGNFSATVLLGTPVTGDVLDPLSTVGTQGPSTTITVTLGGNPLLTPGGLYSSGALTAGSPTGLYVINTVPVGLDPLGNANVLDAVGNYAHVQTWSTGVDLGPGVDNVAIAWDDLTIAGKLWDIGVSDVGQVHQAFAAFPPNGLVARNVGNTRAKFTVSCTGSAPSGWALASVAAPNAFEMKVDASTPLDGVFELDLGTGPKDIVTQLYSGHNKPFDLRFATPTSLTSGGSVSQDITVTITITKD